MKIVLPPGHSPSTFGVGMDEKNQMLCIITVCCSDKVEDGSEIRYSVDGLDGAPDGPVRLECASCRAPYKGYINMTSPIGDGEEYIADHWITPWLGFDRGTVTIEVIY